jgi:putative aldouronate transport system substrate-binding protein
MIGGNVKKIFFVSGYLFFITALIFGGGRQSGQAAPAADEKPVLVLGMPANTFITGYENNYLTQYMENLHHVGLDFYMLPSGSAEIRSKVSLMVASDDLPDILMISLPTETVLEYGSKGAIIPLNKYLDDPAAAPHFAAIREADKVKVLNSITSADGNIYSLFKFETGPWNDTSHRLWINQAWLNKLGLKTPATTGELRDVLTAFRDQDPNGNGRKDEIGLYGWFEGGYGENTIAALLNSFIFYNKDRLSLDASGGRIIAPFTEGAFRKGLIYLSDLAKEGLLRVSLFTDDQQTFRATLNNDPPIVGMTTAGSLGNWPDADANANFLEMTLIPPLRGPDGISYTPYNEYVPSPLGMISSRSKNQDLAFKFLESFLDLDLSMTARWGEEGVDWTRDPEYLSGLTNEYVSEGLFPALYSTWLRDNWVTPNNRHWHNANPRYVPIEISMNEEGYSRDTPVVPKASLNRALHYKLYADKYPSRVLPALKYTLPEAEQLGMTITDVNDYVNQSIAEFVTGARDINNDAQWNAYLRQLDNLGLQKWIQISQTAYGRMRR